MEKVNQQGPGHRVGVKAVWERELTFHSASSKLRRQSLCEAPRKLPQSLLKCQNGTLLTKGLTRVGGPTGEKSQQRAGLGDKEEVGFKDKVSLRSGGARFFQM